jgi:hypothetical protein
MKRSAEDTIKDRYTCLRRTFHPGYTPNDLKVGNDWDEAAVIARSIGADPALFVDAQFAACSNNSKNKFPWPSQLHSSFAANNYLEFVEKSIGSPPDMKLQQQNYLLSAQLDGLSLKGIDIALSKASLPFKSWFRMLMCSDANLEKFRSVWGICAKQQMSNDKDLLQFLRNKYGARTDRLF